MPMRTDPFRGLDRFAEAVLGSRSYPAVMPMDAWRVEDRFVIEFDLPGVARDSIDLDVEHNVLTVRAERAARDDDVPALAAERPRGIFSRQLVLGDDVDLDRTKRRTATAFCTSSSRSPRRPGLARSRSRAARTPRSSTPDRAEPNQTGDQMYPSKEAREIAILLRISRELDIVGDITATVDNPSELLAWATTLTSPDIIAWRSQDPDLGYLQVAASHRRSPVRGRVTAVLPCAHHPEFWNALGLEHLAPGATKHLELGDLSAAWSVMPITPADAER